MSALKSNGDFGGHPHRYELIDKDGQTHGAFANLPQAIEEANRRWPDQEPDPERLGFGWDIQTVRD
jgi:hypothetical protein